MRALEKDPAKRFATVADLAMALVAFGPARTRANAERASHVLRVPAAPPAAVTQPMPGAPVSSVSAPSYARTEGAWADTAGVKKEKSRAPVVIGSVALGVVVATVGFVVLRGGTHAEAPVTTSAAPVMPAARAPEPVQPASPPQIASATVTANESPSPANATAEPAVAPSVGGAPATKPSAAPAHPRPSKKPRVEPAAATAPIDPTSAFGSRK